MFLFFFSPTGDILTFSNNKEYIVLNLYQNGKYPLGCIGIIKFLWTSEVADDGHRNGIVFSHPSIVSQFVNEVEQFNVNLCPDSVEEKDSIQAIHNSMEFVILRLTGNQSAWFLGNVLCASTDVKGNSSFKKEISRASGQSVLNGVVKDPRIFIPKNKQNPTKSQAETGNFYNNGLDYLTSEMNKFFDFFFHFLMTHNTVIQIIQINEVELFDP